MMNENDVIEILILEPEEGQEYYDMLCQFGE